MFEYAALIGTAHSNNMTPLIIEGTELWDISTLVPVEDLRKCILTNPMTTNRSKQIIQYFIFFLQNKALKIHINLYLTNGTDISFPNT
jgi:hypothetical protein